MASQEWHRDQYKSTGLPSNSGESAARRRIRLLDEQKLKRQSTADEQRLNSVQRILDDLEAPSDSHPDLAEQMEATADAEQPHVDRHDGHRRRSRQTRPQRLQLSEWLLERPADLHDNWTLVACPLGMRCLLVARRGRTCLFSRHGAFVRAFRSPLPGGGAAESRHNADVTVLDCVQTTADGLCVLDVLAWGRQDFVECDAEFRFFWLADKFADGVESGDARNRMHAAVRFDCDRPDRIAGALRSAALAGPDGHSLAATQIDGLLFYHKRSTYVSGRTPLVGWLFAFMLGEVLLDDCWQTLHPQWTERRPADYTDAIGYVEQFERQAVRNRAQKRRSRRKPAMDVDVEQCEGEQMADE